MIGVAMLALAGILAAWAALLPRRRGRPPGPATPAERLAAYGARLAVSTEPTVRSEEETIRAARKGATVKRCVLKLDQADAVDARLAQRRQRARQAELFDPPPVSPSNVVSLPKRKQASR